MYTLIAADGNKKERYPVFAKNTSFLSGAMEREEKFILAFTRKEWEYVYKFVYCFNNICSSPQSWPVVENQQCTN